MKQHKSNHRLLTMILFCGILLLSSITALGQSTTEGSIGGTVVDPSGRVVPGAPVVVRNNATTEEFKATTNSIGYFRVDRLQPAVYTVTIHAEGFAAYKAGNVIVTVGSLTPVTPHLKVGTTETVDVSAEAPLVNVTSADFSNTLNNTAVDNLPINGGRWSSFSLLTPGVVSNSSGYGLVSVRGMSELLNNVTVDGADDNQAFFSEERGRTREGYSTPKVAIQEFQVNTSNYSAEYGRAAGAVINTVTKSGGNSIHGEAYWEDRDNAWGSMTPFTSVTSPVYGNGTSALPTSVQTVPYKAEDVRKMGGFGVGGPLIKDKLFWFVAFDRYHRNFPAVTMPSSSASTFFAVPDAALVTGVSCGGSGSAAPSIPDENVCSFAALINKLSSASKVTGTQYSAAAQLWDQYMFGGNGSLGLISDSGLVPRTGDQDIFFPKLDWIINNKNHASFEFNRLRWWAPAGIYSTTTNSVGAGTYGNDYVADTWGIAKLDTAFTNTINNQLRFQYGRDFEWETNQTPTAYDAANLISSSSPFGSIPPNVSISGGITIGSSNYGNRLQYPNEYKTQIADTVSYQFNRHNVKFGFDWMNSNDTEQQLYYQYGSFSYPSVAAYFADVESKGALEEYNYLTQAFQGTATGPAQAYQFSTNDLAFFAQDDWKVSRRLTVNLGLRYETELMPNAYSSLVNTITLGTQNITLGKMPNTPQDWGPRVGFAWDMLGDGKTVLRGGYGMFFGRVINSAIFNALTETDLITSLAEPQYQVSGTDGGAYTASACASLFPNVLSSAPAGCAGSLSSDYFDPNFKMPQIHEVDLALQREIGWHTVLSVSYLGSFGRHMQSFTDSNLANPGTPYCATSSGAQAALVNGACPAADKVVTPPSTISYTLTNALSGNTVSGMPLSDNFTATVPFYTSRLNYTYGTVIENTSNVNSSYNALVIQVDKHLSNHVQFGANYTWSHALDYGVNGTTFTSSYPAWIDAHNIAYGGQYGNSNYNVPNRLTFNAVILSPWQAEGWKKYLVEGWEAAPVVQMQNGLPYSVQTASTKPAMYVGTQEYQGISYGMLGDDGSYQIPGTGRNAWKQPSTYVFDLRLAKKVTLSERYNLEFTADGFNLFNHQNVTGTYTSSAYNLSTTKPATGTPSTTITGPVLAPYSNYVTTSNATEFGVPSQANNNFVYGARMIQLGARLLF